MMLFHTFSGSQASPTEVVLYQHRQQRHELIWFRQVLCEHNGGASDKQLCNSILNLQPRQDQVQVELVPPHLMTVICILNTLRLLVKQRPPDLFAMLILYLLI